MASYSISYTSTTITFTITGLTAGTVVTPFVRLYDDTSDVTIRDWITATGSTVTQTYSGLSPDTRYVANVMIDNTTWIGSQVFVTDEETVVYFVRLNFLANGGSGAPSSKSGSSTGGSVYVTIPSTIPTRDGYTFLGWSTSSTATSPTYYAGYSYYFTGGAGTYNNIYLYAVWQKNSYKFNLYLPTDAGITSVSIRNSSNVFLKTGYPLGISTPSVTLTSLTDGLILVPTLETGTSVYRWVVNVDGTVTYQYETNCKYTYTGYETVVNIRLEVQTILNYATLSFNANGGSGAPGSVSANGTSTSLSITIPTTTPTRSGYTFLGWSTSSTATAPSYYAGYTYTWTASASGTTHTLYAVWVKNVVYGVVYINGVAYVPYIYNNGWQKAKAHIYNGGWTQTKEE